MSNEVTEWIKELWIEIKGLISMVNDHSKKVRSKAERKLIRIIKNRKTVNKSLVKKSLVNKQEIIVIKQGGSLLTNLLLLYLCLFITFIVIGGLSYFLLISSELPFNKLVEVSRRCDEIDCFDRFIEWVEADFPLTTDSPDACGRIINGTVVPGECSEW